jgi:hypothetical protein
MISHKYREAREFVRPLVDQYLDLELKLTGADTHVVSAIAAELMSEGFSERRRIIKIIHRMVPHITERRIVEIIEAYCGNNRLFHRWSVDDEGHLGLLTQ